MRKSCSLFAIGSLRNPRRFAIRKFENFDSVISRKKWVIKGMFQDYPEFPNTLITKSSRRQVLFLVDKNFLKGEYQSLPILLNVFVHFLPKHAIEILQTSDARERLQLEWDVDCPKSTAYLNLCKVNLRWGRKWLYNKWQYLPITIMRNYLIRLY